VWGPFWEALLFYFKFRHGKIKDMTHRKLLISMAGLLVLATGGVFVLVHQRGGEEEFLSEAFVAGLRVEKPSDNELFEAKLQTEELAEQTAQPQQPSPAPNPEPRLLSPTKKPTPASEPVPAPQSSASQPTPQPLPQLSPPPPPVSPPAPVPQPSSAVPPPSPTPPAISFPININTAGLEELQAIAGIGPVLAQRVIDYRNANGLFYNIENIKNVSGIGDVTFEKMKGEITVGNVVMPNPELTSPPSSETSASQGKININTAGYEELQQIMWVGEVIAQRIIDYRNQNGPFHTVEEIKNVKGIGDATFEKMKDEVMI